MKKILVIGGAGYIGSHVVKAMLDAGLSVRVFDNLSTGQEINLFGEAEFVKGDILDYDAVLEAMDGVDGVVHLAAKKAVGQSMIDPDLYSRNNIIGTVNILMAMSEIGVSNIVFSSSAAVYGMPQYLPLDEEHPLCPINYYGFTKLKIEEFLKWYDQLKGIKFVSLRYFNAVGYDATGAIKGREVGVENLLPVVMEVLAGKRMKLSVYGTDFETRDGTCIRDYVHVSDLADAHVLSMQMLFDGGESQVFNLGTGNGTTVKEIVSAVEKVFEVEVNKEYSGRRAGDPAELYASSAKAENMLGWKPKYINIDDIVRTVG